MKRYKASRNHKRQGYRQKNHPRRWSWVLVVSLLVVVGLCLLLLTGRGRAIGKRVPVIEAIQRMIFGGPKVPEASAYGIDISRYQGQIRWDEVSCVPFNSATRRQLATERNASVRLEFAFAKATEGVDYVDPSLATNRDGIRRASLLYGAYHVLTLANPKDQATNFIRNSGLTHGDLAPVVDIEESIVGRNVFKAREVLAALLQLLEREYGVRPIIYCSNSYRDVLLNSSQLKSYPLWIARYLTDKAPDGADIWQFSDSGNIPGVDMSIDLDALYNGRYKLTDYVIK